jgi:hypothetical protein
MALEFEDALRLQIATLEERRAKLMTETTRLDGQLAGLCHALALFLGELPDSKSDARQSRVPDPTKSESWAFVLTVLEKAAPSGISADEIQEQAERAGHMIARNTLSANLSNASKERIIERVSRGRYRKRASANGCDPADIESEPAPHQSEPLGLRTKAGELGQRALN